MKAPTKKTTKTTKTAKTKKATKSPTNPKNTFTKMGRQGDVLLVRVDKDIPVNAPVPATPGYVNKTILAFGEVTGHHHRFETMNPEEAVLYSIVNEPEDQLLKTNGMRALVHEEHDAILPAPGTYRKIIQREYVYGTTRKVVD